MKGLLAAVIAASLFGIGGTFGQFLFTHRGVNLEWLVTMRLLGAGVILLGLTFARKGTAALAIWRNRSDALQLLLFGIEHVTNLRIVWMQPIEGIAALCAGVVCLFRAIR